MNAYLDMLSKLEAEAKPSPPSDEAAESSRLRTALAVRGWVDPRLLLSPGLSAETSTHVLDSVAPDVETDWRTHPKEWFLRDDVRRRILVTRSAADLTAVLDVDIIPGDKADPVRAALRARRSPLPLTLDGFDSEVLTALASSLIWLAPAAGVSAYAPTSASAFWHVEPDADDARERIGATIAHRRRQADVARMTQAALYGREDALQRLVDLATRPITAGVAGYYIYVSGIGGSGKSTLFAHLERALHQLPDPPLLVHLDCDQPGFDPTDILALDIALFRQLSVALPERAVDLRSRIAQLAAAARSSDLGYAERTSSAPPAAVQKGLARKSAPRNAVARHAVASFDLLERAFAERQAARQSISWNALKDASGGRPLVLLVDTAELIFARGQDAVQIVLTWIGSLGPALGIPDPRLVVAGRGPADASGPLAFEQFLTRAPAIVSGDWIIFRPIVLEDLDEADAEAMLKSLGVDDPALAAKAAAALPRTPLILRIAADAYLAGDTERGGFVEAVSSGAIDSSIAARYLTERVIRHTAATAARPYVLAAMVLPEVTQQLVRHVLIPTVDEIDREQQRTTATEGERVAAPPSSWAPGEVFEGLSTAGWLVRVSSDGPRLTFHPEVRRLVLTLMDAEPNRRALVRRIRQAALRYYEPRRTPAERTLAAYFAELLGAQPGGAKTRRLKPEALGTAIEDLSDESRARLFGTLGPVVKSQAVGTYAETDSAAEWRQRLEGSDRGDGEGDRLVKRARAAEALALYRDRPTRPSGIPPTFVIQALADNAEWSTGEVDVDGIVNQLRLEAARSSGTVPNTLRSRLYWLTRYALLAAPGPLSKAHSALLRQITGRISGRGPVLLFPGILAVAEALSPDSGPLAPDDWFRTKGAIESETRMFLVHSLHFGREATWWPHLDALLVTQPDWASRFAKLLSGMGPHLQAEQRLSAQRWSELLERLASSRSALTRQLEALSASSGLMSPRGTSGASVIRQALNYGRQYIELGGLALLLEALIGRNLAFDLPVLNALLRELRQPVPLFIGTQTDPKDKVFLLRGLTTEIHRPLRAAIGRLAAIAPAERSRLEAIARRCAEGFGFKPREFANPEFQERLSRDLTGIYTILIPFADRSRRLPDLCEDLASTQPSTPEVAVVTRVAKAFLAWDAALCAGRSSTWQPKQAGPGMA